MPGDPDVLAVAQRREQQGWSGIGVGDHLNPNGIPYGHMATLLGYLAAGTSRLRLVTTYANSLLRSPVEYAHMALTVQQLSGGRFEAGLGAGWAEEEISAHGIDYPAPAERARRYREAATIVRELLDNGSSHYAGRYYRAAVDDIGVPVERRPPLGVSVGGSWTAEHLSPLADWVEVAPFARAIRAGHMNLGEWGDGSATDVETLLAVVSAANPSARLSLGCFVAVGTSSAVDSARQIFGEGPLSGLAGPPAQVAETLSAWEQKGFTDCMLGELVPGSIDALADLLV